MKQLGLPLARLNSWVLGNTEVYQYQVLFFFLFYRSFRSLSVYMVKVTAVASQYG